MKLEPLALDQLPPAVAGLVAGAAPAKAMVVRGMAPLRPAELLIAVYQLAFDADEAVRSAAETAPASLPDKIILAPLSERLPAPVLHFFAEHLPVARQPALERILHNPATADDTFILLAGRLGEGGLEIICQNEVRLLRCPAIVETLYFNKQARMSSVSHALELCARNNVRLEGIPEFAAMVSAFATDAQTMTPSAPDEAFAAALQEDEPVTLQVPAGNPMPAGDAPRAEAGREKKNLGLAFVKFDQLKIFEKVRLATIGNAHCRQVLIRDTNKLVAMSVIRSPSITNAEVVAAASSRAVCDDVIRFISNSRAHTKDYAVKLALVNNPKCPLGASLRLLVFLHPEDLRAIAHSRNIPGALAAAAKKLLLTRGKPGAA